MFITYILGVTTNFRGNELIEKLMQYGIKPNVVWGPELENDHQLLLQHTNQKFANFAIGRDIKPQEIACCLGHIRMYEYFSNSSREWGLFLEDDAIMILDPTPLINNLPKTDEPIHIFIHDGPGTNLPLPRNHSLEKLGLSRRLDPQYGAYGYVLNQAAVSEILKSPIKLLINTPDWPYFWPRNIKFFTSKDVYFSHPKDTSMSIIGDRINKAANLRNQFPSLRKVKAGLKFYSDIRHIVYKEIYSKICRITLQVWKKSRI
jgi:hypothetical protein